jgi:HlyD family secretion protein
MSAVSEEIFRASAIERLSSPEQLDQLIEVTRPADWIATLLIVLCLTAAVTWSVVGRIPTRVAGEGILVSDGGRLVDSVAAVGGRLAAVNVAVGDHVKQGQVVAHIAQTDIEQRYTNAAAALKELEHEHEELTAAIKRELDIKAANVAAQQAGLQQSIAAAQERVEYLTKDVATLQELNKQNLVRIRDLEDRRADLATSQQRITDARNEIQRLEGQLHEDESQRQLDALASQFRVNQARRHMEQLAGTLERDTRIVSPIDGQVFEIKVSAGGVLAAGTPVVAIQSEGTSLEGIVYVPADRGKDIQPGMQVRIEPSTVRPEEFGTMLGEVSSVSAFPVTAEGMAAVLHNDALVKRFSEGGAPYAVLVRLARDSAAFSGYHWSSGNGPPIRLSTGTLARAEVTTREQPPINLVIPIMRRLSGIED